MEMTKLNFVFMKWMHYYFKLAVKIIYLIVPACVPCRECAPRGSQEGYSKKKKKINKNVFTIFIVLIRVCVLASGATQ